MLLSFVTYTLPSSFTMVKASKSSEMFKKNKENDPILSRRINPKYKNYES